MSEEISTPGGSASVTIQSPAAQPAAPAAGTNKTSDQAQPQQGSVLSQEARDALYGDGEVEITQTQRDDPTLIMGKYRNVGELESAYKELQRHKGMDRVPDAYDLSPLAEHDLPVYDAETYPEEHARHTERLRKGNFTQEQVAIGAEIISEFTRELTSKYGPMPDAEQEMQTLQKSWGTETDAKRKQVHDWAKQNLQPDVMNALGRTANGMMLIEQLMGSGKGRGPVPITGSRPATQVSESDIRAEITAKMRDPSYYANNAQGRALQEQVDKLFGRLDRMKKK